VHVIAHISQTRCIRDGLEGLVVKDKQSVYEPGARHWLKIKKDYLQVKWIAVT
jgi:ATP-dependent DNA ligase